MTLTPKNWQTFQHYKDRSPAWIKLHRSLLDDFEFASLPVESRALAPMLWLLASEREGGSLPGVEEIAFRLRAPSQDIADAINPLIDKGFLIETGEPATRERWPSRYVSDKQRATVMERDGGKCVKCSSVENLEIDHITPISKGGSSEMENLQVLCRSCNRAKRTKSSEQFATQQRSLEKSKEREEKIGAIAPMFAFNGTVIRLNAKNFQQWKTAYPNIDLTAELTARDTWLASPRAADADRENWFVSTAAHLANRNQAARNAPARKVMPDGIL